ncbi:MAG TPA: DUF4199 domain-containing protein [Chitinophagales bacterium]|nr:DUF4199 domain-containing protein [Chitinophagales bacterium]
MENNSLDTNQNNNSVIEIKEIAIRYGIIGGLAGILASLIVYFANVQYETWSKWLQTLILLLTIVLCVKSIADENKGKEVAFGVLFKGGMLATAVLTAIAIIYFMVYINVIEPDFIDNLLQITKTEMLNKGLSEEQADAAIKISKKFMSPAIMVSITTISSLIIGAIVSAISAAIFKREN